MTTFYTIIGFGPLGVPFAASSIGNSYSDDRVHSLRDLSAARRRRTLLLNRARRGGDDLTMYSILETVIGPFGDEVKAEWVK